jgi:hypothetical protein
MQLMQLMGVASSFVSALVLALYVQSQMPSGAAQRPTVARIIVPLVLFWECRIWLSTARGQMNEDPIVFAARDWVVAGCSRLFRYLAARSGDQQFSLPGLLGRRPR